MIFVGDIAIPKTNLIDYEDIRNKFKDKLFFGNLEGTVVKSDSTLLKKKIVFNDFKALEQLSENISFAGVALANNHLFDIANFKETKKHLCELNLRNVGAGNNLKEARKNLNLIDSDDTKIKILNFGWEGIGCKIASKNQEGTNAYRKKNVLEQVSEALNIRQSEKIIVFFHWNYELELFPQPLDRELSHQLIDMGIDAVIGCHSHQVQGAEFYKGKPIVYSLGNWVFPHKIYWDYRLTFPEVSRLQLAFEMNFTNNELYCHWFKYDPAFHKIKYMNSENFKDSKILNKLTPYKKLDNNQYRNWFSKKRLKKKLLPIFYFNDSMITYSLKVWWLNFRHYILMLLLKIKKA